MLALLSQSDFENLPIIYRLLGPQLENAHSETRPYILDALKPLAERSPQETAHFLRQSLARANQRTTNWLLRRSLEFFPQDTQANLRAALKK